MAADDQQPLAQLRPVSTVEALSNAVRDDVLNGVIEGGQPLREAELCARFGVSRHTARTAMQSLVHEGLLRHERNRGTFVSLPGADDIRDIFRMRAMIELHAARSLTGRSAALDGCRTALEEFVATAESGTWEALRDKDLAFHRALVNALGSARISRTFDTLLLELRLCFLGLRKSYVDAKPTLVLQHRELMEALESGEPEEAAATFQIHLDRACGDVIDELTR